MLIYVDLPNFKVVISTIGLLVGLLVYKRLFGSTLLGLENFPPKEWRLSDGAHMIQR